MKSSHTVSKKEASQASLAVTVKAADAEGKYTETLQKYAKSIQIPGFRKGKAPLSVLENKYGESLKAEAAAEIIDACLEDILQNSTRKNLNTVHWHTHNHKWIAYRS